MGKRGEGFPGGRPLYIGSLPFHDHDRALSEVLHRTPETPHWVQLPANPGEGFLVQFCEGMPGLRTAPGPRIQNRSAEFEAELLAFYEDFLSVTERNGPLEGSRFAVSRKAAPGLFALRDSLRERTPLIVKGQVSGPLTVLLGIQDDTGRAAYYDDRVRDSMVKLLALKGRWQTAFLSETGARPMVFVDEPAFGNLGSSAYISISPEGALADLGEILRAVRDAGGLPGVHVCANADWGSLLTTDLQVLSFDAFSYFERVVLFQERLWGFLRGGGMLAWGIVPTSPDALQGARGRELADLWLDQAGELARGKGTVEEVLEHTLITPSCGLGSLVPELAVRAMDLTVEVSNRLREA